MGDVPNGSWNGSALIEQPLKPTWSGTLSGDFSFLGDHDYIYYNGKNHISQGQSHSYVYGSGYLHYLKGSGRQHSSLMFDMKYYCPQQTSACAIVIWRNGKLIEDNS
jgi:hypothetical protein